MSFMVQHGYGKAQKISDLHNRTRVAGVILSPGDEDEDALSETAKWCSENDLKVFIDPQTYRYSTRPPGAGRKHDVHGLDFGGLTWAEDADSVSRFIAAVGRLNSRLNSNGEWIAPAPLQDTLADVWTPLAVQFARTAGHQWGADRTIATVAIDESALADWGSVERWLDVVTTLPVSGFYILVSRPSTNYPPLPWAPAKLSNLLRLVHALGTLNDFKVILGFTEFEGILSIAVGGSVAASGWSYTLRQFSSAKWMNPATGGRPATVRTHLSRMWSLPKAESESAILFNSEFKGVVFTPAEVARFDNTSFDALTRSAAQVDFLEGLAVRSNLLSSEPSISERVRVVQGSLERAIELWDQVSGSGLIVDPSYRNRVVSLRDGLNSFVAQVAL
ncbi:hypothetical protein BJEO58_00719 [Brevibacterium jeotgali]|uniref:Uncharacterized protein n=1 Tax=Brevibacterium jeotgali TaxID=1262550 RepID=A0A2H1L2K7_9MICO|nr:hypothetical protein FB108_1018 [Brevibacterium jeotgali]SMY11137.1 hypothetical protein BJEO58_00719 [Brevibacterium jeotgali]